jgi:hypothetical protein
MNQWLLLGIPLEDKEPEKTEPVKEPDPPIPGLVGEAKPIPDQSITVGLL